MRWLDCTDRPLIDNGASVKTCGDYCSGRYFRTREAGTTLSVALFDVDARPDFERRRS